MSSDQFILLPIAQLQFNEDNPRQIREPKFQQLLTSLLEFPEMLYLRPTVVNGENLVLGGNMRGRAKVHLLGLPESEKAELIERHVTHRRARREQRNDGLSQDDEAKYRKLLTELLYAERLPVMVAAELSEDQAEEFIFKDNIGFGQWDADVIANKFDHLPLAEWGLELPNWHAGDLDSFFEEGGEGQQKEAGVRIVLDYTEEEGQQVKDALAKVAATPEQAVWELLKLGK